MAKITDTIINNVSIVSEVEQFVNLTKKGQNYLGICPFHDDNNPSFTVNDEKKIFKCFVCGVGGNVIKFTQMISNISFPEAVINLGEKYHIDVSSYKKTNQNNPLFQNDLKQILSLNNSVNDIFIDMLKESDKAKEYLQGRNLTQDTIDFFKIGYKNDNVSEIAELLANINVDYKTQEQSGLVSFTKDKIIDFFIDRITIPITDDFNNIVGFGSRTLDKEQSIKYLNTKETKLFNKRNTLFNLYNAKKDIYDNNKNSIIVVEGYMDVISLHNQQIRNVVGVMTNNITKEQVQKLASLRKEILLCLDYDKAGIQGTYDFINKFGDVNVKIIPLEKNLDPDEYINKYGRNKFVEQITKAQTKDEFLFELDALGIDVNRNKIYQNNVSSQIPVENYAQGEYIPPIEQENVDGNYYEQSDNVSEQVVETKVSQKIESELIIWIYNNQEKYINEQLYNNLGQKFFVSNEQKQLIRLEYSVFKWFINGQIDTSRVQEYFPLLSTNIIKSWITKHLLKDKSLNNITKVIKTSFKEEYNENLDMQIFEIISTWNYYDKLVENELIKANKLNDVIIIRREINSILTKQKFEFFSIYKKLRR